MKNFIYLVVPFVITLTLDIITKNLIVKNLNINDKIDYLNGFLRITLVYNEGGVFGILQGYKNFFLIVSIIVLILMIIYYSLEKNKTVIFSLSMGLILSGAIGNIIDRLIEGRRGVVDFVSIGVDGIYRWPAFNVADAVIILGAGLLIIFFYKEEKKQNSSA